MQRLLGLILLVALIFGVYYFLTKRTQPQVEALLPPSRMKITQTPGSFSDILSVLGASTSRIWESSLNSLNNVTDGAAEPVINKAVNDLQERIKELPKEQYEKVKYEFCKDVVNSYEEQQ